LPDRIVIKPQTKTDPVEKVEPVFPKDGRVRNPLPVAATLRNAHPLVCATRQVLLQSEPDQHGMLWATPYSQECIPAKVSRSQCSRALRILDALVKELARLGATFKADSNARELYVRMDGTDISISIREGYRQHRLTDAQIEEIKKRNRYFYGRYSYEPTGKLELKVSSSAARLYHSWREGPMALEGQLTEAASVLLQAPVDAKRIEEQEHQERLRHWNEEERARAEEAARQAERRARAELVAEAKSWQTWQCVVAYLGALKESLNWDYAHLSEAGRQWLSKAGERAIELNPLTRRRAQLTSQSMPSGNDELQD
jgi:hypothetical protein